MPSRPSRPCRYSMCQTLVNDGTGWCSQHRNSDRKLYDRLRGSAYSRGYDKRWQAFRLRYLRQHPLCVHCLDKEPSIISVATEIHHRKKLSEYPELKYEEDNLMALDKECHARRSQRGE